MMDIKKLFEKVKEHEDYCNKYCIINKTDFKNYPHTDKCVLLSHAHYQSFVECDSAYCKNICKQFSFSPTHKKITEKKKLIKELTYYTDSE